MANKVRDISGQVFGRLTVQHQAGRAPAGQVLWNCLCVCGKTKVVASSLLIRGQVKSCGCVKENSATHKAFSVGDEVFSYRVVAEMPERRRGSVVLQVSCSLCSATFKICAADLMRRKPCTCCRTTSHRPKTHGYFTKAANNSETYDGERAAFLSWRGVMARCFNEKHTAFHNYRGRGISVCQTWRTFENFLNDMGPRPEGLTLDRVDNDGDYAPGNCRWATRKEQLRNTRVNQLVSYDDRLVTVAELAEIAGLNYQTVRNRLRSGWTPEQATRGLKR